MFAWKPAPVQASWPGYFATTGVAEMDYLLGDPYVTPAGEEGHFTEERVAAAGNLSLLYPARRSSGSGAAAGALFRLHHLRQLQQPRQDERCRRGPVGEGTPGRTSFASVPQGQPVERPRRPRCHPPAFCRVWDHPRPAVAGRHSPRAEMLEAYNRVDIILGPFPYPGGTTSVEGLWMGVPAITRRGDCFLSHIGESIAHNAGLADWIAEDDDDYVAKAVHAHDRPGRLAALRGTLRATGAGLPALRRSPLCPASRSSAVGDVGTMAEPLKNPEAAMDSPVRLAYFAVS